MIFFTSDTHFGHANVIEYSDRPYGTAAEMDEDLIARWNARVTAGDTVYHLGDVAFSRGERLRSILQRLNGQKFLIYGNHDKAIHGSAELRSCFVRCADYDELTFNSQRIVLCHYPMITWHRAHLGSWMLHGHCHGNLRYPFDGKLLDVGVDVHRYRPISFYDVEALMAPKGFTALDHHTERDAELYERFLRERCA